MVTNYLFPPESTGYMQYSRIFRAGTTSSLQSKVIIVIVEKQMRESMITSLDEYLPNVSLIENRRLL